MRGYRSPGFSFQTTYGAEDDRLSGFFVPALARAVRYDRATGYFTSSALASVARGLAEFLQNDGRMRLLAGADLVDEDVAALEKGAPLDEVLVRRLLADPLEGADIIQRRRLEVLAWMVKEGRLDIRIGVPVDEEGRPLARHASQRYFHKKTGILTDAEGNRLAFVGSNNESHSGLEEDGNLEEFSVYPSWRTEAWQDYGQPTLDRFEQQWNDGLLRWRVIPLPDAIRDSLIARVKHLKGPPSKQDPALDDDSPKAPEDIGHPPQPAPAPPEPIDEHLTRLRFLAEAPRKDGGTGVGLVTAPVEPWPHQRRIAHRITITFPRSYLLADEVGMGKTIEAGLVFRELLLSGKAERILALVPASVINQWQEELDEKFLLRIPRLDGGTYYYRRGGEDELVEPPQGGNPWGAFPVLLASSHLARRKSRRQQIIDAGPWDVVFVDEAHHARRKGSQEDDSPNTLLTLLQAMKEAGSWKALYLASATPMQMHAHEAWDLLELLGLTERWGSSATAFTTYFSQLREEPGLRDWRFLQVMLADHLASEENTPLASVEQRVHSIVPRRIRAKRILQFHERGIDRSVVKDLPPEDVAAFDLWLRENTPMRRRVFRTTRTTLHDYKRDGLLDADTVIPDRQVEDRFIAMRPGEARLYRRIEDYIGRYYNRYRSGTQAQRALGFIMTVYRRRLTSSFLAIERSLRKRRTALTNDGASLEALLDADDVSAVETGSMFELEELEAARIDLAREFNELDEFLAELEKRPPDESKMQALHDDLEDAFMRGHRTAIVFTQYGATMDYIADQLTGQYGSAVATWSGAGGARWNPKTRHWEKVSKPILKDLFRAGEEVKILVGTDSMSEGLNLQTCGFLVNYDMPWNFMRVEQRIGRIDRIGGQPVVEVRNYFYKDTVEQQIYEGLVDDVDWFQSVVGPARPVLGQIESIIEEVAMKGDEDERQSGVQEAIQRIQSNIEAAKQQPVDINDVAAAPYEEEPEPIVTLPEIERELVSNPITARYLAPVAGESKLYRLSLDGAQVLVTFNRAVAEERSPDVQLMTYGSGVFDRFLAYASRSPWKGERASTSVTSREVEPIP